MEFHSSNVLMRVKWAWKAACSLIEPLYFLVNNKKLQFSVDKYGYVLLKRFTNPEEVLCPAFVPS